MRPSPTEQPAESGAAGAADEELVIPDELLDDEPTGLLHTQGARLLCLLSALILLLATVVASLMIGARPIPVTEVWHALFADDDSIAHDVMWELRVPRTLYGLAVAPAFGLAGALIQALTRNPLADPGILGVNAGAGLAVTIAVGYLGVSGSLGYIWFAMLGAGVVTVAVYVIGSTGGGAATPIRLTLAGVALGAVLDGIASGISLRNSDLFIAMRWWGVGTISGRDLSTLLTLLPFILAGLVMSLVVASALNVFAMGDDIGRALGASLLRTQVLVVAAVTLLAGTATALVGPIAFVGLMVPHAVRWFTGPDQRWIFAFTIVVSPILLLVSDIIGRVMLPTGEVPVGLVTAMVGAPVLILLARRRKLSSL